MDIIEAFFKSTQWEKILTDLCVLERLKNSIGMANAVKVCRYWIKQSGEPDLSRLKEQAGRYTLESPPTRLLEQLCNQEQTMEYVKRFVTENGGEE
ncbi:TPA: hypothetical protein DIU27_05440 [Candidatus Collierbacteria bacterium]|uniref:Uncharacterized protein n=1 Tax=Candidatus Collierbacteria bacterium GW2011_GWB2_44_22 TaxID=1618387 RepID=A0A0G1K6G4_9BACT|nr:MAG: hypothetical protein UW31_C0002G0058 [Candidatus Collierbacteria bacterium GW2011_GWA2_44_13]KKT51917.1 MAG: hypothetical protein UW44_C0006G0035 [Candidatus Collierbacteria bacterium GW2011_GWB2_44_22]KKT61871.1 MAG: hypothetical protein UW56_C0016G0005 [Candidatus Collierbacteria bacterium GW2011_GWD1_44_27]KKT66159.1 MAG: hypothetical protein UW58_C0012G0001 [Candidatus Collierbacteria bacterium GW2011_GWC2_44_30]KKT87795.1 MAG: hypothetical protein UW88_C0021G0017 [Candidatus Collie